MSEREIGQSPKPSQQCFANTLLLHNGVVITSEGRGSPRARIKCPFVSVVVVVVLSQNALMKARAGMREGQRENKWATERSGFSKELELHSTPLRQKHCSLFSQ